MQANDPHATLDADMGFQGLLVTEIFRSIQGETSLSGLPFVFVRLTGCNLRCSYCDSAYSFKGGQRMTQDEVIEKVKAFNTPHVLLTGGEPLLQRGAVPLAKALTALGYHVSVETHGEVSIEAMSAHARIIMDIKTPGSKMNRGKFEENLKFLKPTDEIKFVLVTEADYIWARDLVRSRALPTSEILFSPAVVAENSPEKIDGLNPTQLADWILRDQLPVRFQIQLHKLLWGANTTGV